ncbi:hypothetical protein PRUPE_1G303200 [Prunus persica]|uniref:Uncharacterized protein n=1 Tax=Prunus persica TaxID=3760 RepID=M5XK46_PRUPE|nr:hypothetical protein PRUPE_1G303200 [Prunus persica]
MVVICSHLSSLFNILLYHSFSEHSHDHCYCFPSEQTIEQSLGTIEEGDEVRELRCVHLFHRQCLDRWTGFQHATCPLCHSFLAPHRSTLVSHSQQFLQSEVLLFKFCSFSLDSDDGDGWWLR